VAPLAVKQRIYDQVQPALSAIAERNNWVVAKAFSEPPGMEQYRRDHPAVINDQSEEPSLYPGL
jgi:hypothetical protein